MADTRTEAQLGIVFQRYLTQGGTGVDTSVAGGATTKAITFVRQEPDTSFGVVATPGWNTTVWVTAKAKTGFTLNFGTVPVGTKTIDWVAFRSED